MSDQPRKRLAIVTTIWNWRSHANHMAERFLRGYPREGRWHLPEMEIVSAYVDQQSSDDLSRNRAAEHKFDIYPTIAETLCAGGDELAVDGVLLIAEHGDYPDNEKGQKLYPRYKFFQQIVEVFRQAGRAVPVFNDKHLSYSFEQAKQMVDTSRDLEFGFLAGSSLPVTFRLPPVELPLGCEIEEAVMVGVGSSDAMDFHALEAMQCMVERRQGGECGVRAVQLVDGVDVWRAAQHGRWSRRLLEAALARSDSRTGISLVDGRPQDLIHSGELERLAKAPAAYFVEYNDGLRATLLMLNGVVNDFTFAAKLRGQDQPLSTQFLLPPSPNVVYSAVLMEKAEELMLTNRAPYPVERTLLVSGLLERCLESRLRGHRRLRTPELDVCYQSPAESQFRQT